MALDVRIEELLARVGHDGGEILFPALPEPCCRRGHHVQELISVALTLGYAVTPIEFRPRIAAAPLDGAAAQASHEVRFGPGLADSMLRFTSHIQLAKGTIECRTANGSGHMLAFEQGRVFDPDGPTFDFSLTACERRGLFAHTVWRFDRIGGPA